MNLRNIAIVLGFPCLGLVVGSGGVRLMLFLKPAPELHPVAGDYARFVGTGERLVLFSTSTCPHCRRAREYLADRHIAYRDYVIDQSADARTLYGQTGESAVPVLMTAQHKMVGFSAKDPESMLAGDGVRSAY